MGHACLVDHRFMVEEMGLKHFKVRGIYDPSQHKTLCYGLGIKRRNYGTCQVDMVSMFISNTRFFFSCLWTFFAPYKGECVGDAKDTNRCDFGAKLVVINKSYILILRDIRGP